MASTPPNDILTPPNETDELSKEELGMPVILVPKPANEVAVIIPVDSIFPVPPSKEIPSPPLEGSEPIIKSYFS